LRELREIVAVVGVEKFGQRVREIAERLHKNPGSVSRWVTNAAERRFSDSGFAKRLRDLDDALVEQNPNRDRSVL
jgi:transposase